MNKDRLRLALKALGGMTPSLDELRIMDPGSAWDRPVDPTVLRDLAVEVIVECVTPALNPISTLWGDVK